MAFWLILIARESREPPKSSLKNALVPKLTGDHLDQQPRTDGILLVGHGTRDPSGTAQFFELSKMLAERAPCPVVGCLLEFQEPTIPQGWQMLVEAGVDRICIAPLLLFAAGHARSDIPELVAECAAKTPHVESWQAGPLSRAGEILSLLESRIRQVAHASKVTLDESTALVMVGRGSYHPCATSDMRVLGQLVAHRTGLLPKSTVGFYAMAEPKLPEVLDRAAEATDIETVLVQPHLLFQGRLYDAIARQVDEAGQRHPSVRFLLGNYLGPCEAVADAVLRRTHPETSALLPSIM
ncbi:MAG: sirohydrochlorin chelatase [Planctomycetota bacterium]